MTNMVQLETVIGLTAHSSAALDCRQTDGTVAYPAGCTVVLLNADGASQSHIASSSKKAVTSLSFSPDGRYLATAERGHQPAVRIWDLNDQSLAAELFGHTFGIACVVGNNAVLTFWNAGRIEDDRIRDFLKMPYKLVIEKEVKTICSLFSLMVRIGYLAAQEGGRHQSSVIKNLNICRSGCKDVKTYVFEDKI
ncbi:hypothetical protein D918_09044 [Trichuris suis]|nr:hypothetical protein D918_09044 [Trichuris suis]